MKKGPIKGKNIAPHVGPKIITIDIETAPISAFTWGLWDVNVGLDMIDIEWSILSFSAKWLHSDEVIYMDTGGRGIGKVRDDKRLLQALWELLDEADIIIAQNGQAFDIKKINARLIMNGFGPYSPIRIIDTMLVSKKHFNFTSNKLAWLSEHLTAAKKSDHKLFPGFLLWEACLQDNPEAWQEMEDYNKIDVISTEQLYLKLRPWIGQHPNVKAYDDSDSTGCPKCGSDKVQKRGLAYTQIGAYQRFQCQACNGWSRSRVATNSKDKRATLLSN